MSEGLTIQLTEEQMSLVRDLLARFIPDREVWVFGSRVHGRRLKRYSDLDLAVLGDTPLPGDISDVLREAFDESLLPYKVDIVDWATTSETFRNIIAREHAVVQTASVKGSGIPVGG